MRFFACMFAALSLTAYAHAGDTVFGRASVIDGDTIEIRAERIRLHGIDAPEAAQRCMDAEGKLWPCGQHAAFALADRIGAATIECRPTVQDRYGRTIATCLLADQDLNAWLVEQGWAMAYRRYSKDYVAEEEAARAAGRGIWQGDFIPPWDYRSGERLEFEKAGSQVEYSGPWRCGTKTTCRQMASCAEAQFHFRACGLHRLDGNRDGVPCQRLCRYSGTN